MNASGTRRSQGTGQRLDSNNTDSIVSTESELSSFNIPMPPRLAEPTRAGLPPLTRTEEKSLANELISQLPIDTPLSVGEQMVRRRACEIVQDNYSQKFLPGHIASDWFYDFLLRNPRVPIHFHAWFSSVKATLPASDQLVDIKVWELGLVTRSTMSSSFISTSPSSSSP